jgi:1-aminocyclopropane-1-carboxylate deaminase/D-cysteine desulfhydrase-like pyridoxal-dependent ACC family enzyme
VITAGGVQSNHVRQTAAAAARLGLACELVLTDNRPPSSTDFAETGNIQLDRLLGARIEVLPAGADRDAAMDARAAALRARGARPYVIPIGGSNATGALGYALCARELAEQAAGLGIGPVTVVLASSSGGTQAGLVAGFGALGHAARVVGVDVDAEPEAVADTVRDLAGATAERLSQPRAAAADAVEVVGGYAGPGYGVPTEAMRAAVELSARLEGVVLDPVYSGKAMAGLIGLVRDWRFGPADQVVFLHTGGAPALFAYRTAFAEPAHD